MTYTNRLKLPLIHSGQAQKEITHNEALNMLDVLVNPIAHEINITSPPDSPKPGKLYVRVIEEITGTGSFGVGVAEDTKRYSNALAITKDTTNIGLTNHPLTYWHDTLIRLTGRCCMAQIFDVILAKGHNCPKLKN